MKKKQRPEPMVGPSTTIFKIRERERERERDKRERFKMKRVLN